ncbi:serine/threonine-protein phosphatase 6 regulatory ankyrin repeat subunit A-like [Stylophora pistillata]|uniref:serine/threonine-protein phosphatase 6 regulatory ankyrin repeat subunit A-like n=1 Tax=Stylophora pistillata TaxID=50429 RepID=UPI000C03AD2F|nr:serine/threonine-protein phosphatase 6 regulatory ankyrin repeat subunit A-like [Stylophora pistillata]
MFVAAKNGNITRLEKFLSLGRDVNSRNDNGVTPLRIAVLYGQSETVRYLLENGADPFVKGSYSRNLLHVASYGGQVAIIDEMIKQGLDVNSKDGNGDTPLILAAAYGREKAVKYLLQGGADPSIKGCYGRTALHAGNDVAIIEILLSSGVHIDTKDADGNTPLIMAAANANVDAVNYLLTKGADQDVKGRLGRNTLHAAAQGGDVVIVETMLSRGLHINSKDSLGDTPLIIASACGKLEAVCLLLVKGAKPLITGQFGRNPLHAAAQCGHAAIIEKLFLRLKIQGPSFVPYYSLLSIKFIKSLIVLESIESATAADASSPKYIFGATPSSAAVEYVTKKPCSSLGSEETFA